jgi:hypothetical protein
LLLTVIICGCGSMASSGSDPSSSLVHMHPILASPTSPDSGQVVAAEAATLHQPLKVLVGTVVVVQEGPRSDPGYMPWQPPRSSNSTVLQPVGLPSGISGAALAFRAVAVGRAVLYAPSLPGSGFAVRAVATAAPDTWVYVGPQGQLVFDLPVTVTSS